MDTAVPGSGTGAVYLLCWGKTPYPAGKRPAHYLGYADPVPGAEPGILARFTGVAGADGLTPAMAAGVLARDVEHQQGKGARLTRAVAAAGIEWRLVRVWPGTGRTTETYLKDLNDRKILCPACNPGTRAGTVITPKRFRRNYLRAQEAAS